jgi:hypothetical protein
MLRNLHHINVDKKFVSATLKAYKQNINVKAIEIYDIAKGHIPKISGLLNQ